MIKVIAFDLVGVLLRENDFLLDDTEDKIERLFGKKMSDDEVIENSIKITDLKKEDVIKSIKKIINNIYDVRYNPIKLKDKYPLVKLVIASNHVSYINELLKKEYKNVFDDIIISSDINKYKPDKEFYMELINRCDVKNNEILFLDDNNDNIGSASILGINTILVKRNDDVEALIDNYLKKYLIFNHK
ncbi:MAG: HAD-IA family hydrolase [Bacilli bacterium]|nr:HAD-IA family hydrolase [Bacilli bacterium]